MLDVCKMKIFTEKTFRLFRHKFCYDFQTSCVALNIPRHTLFTYLHLQKFITQQSLSNHYLVPKLSQNCPKDLPKLSPNCVKEIPKLSQSWVIDVTKLCHSCDYVLSMLCRICVNLCQNCLIEVSKFFQSSLKVVSKLSQRCHKQGGN